MRHRLKDCTLVPVGAGAERMLVKGDRAVNGHVLVVLLETMTERYEPYDQLVASISNGTLIVERTAETRPVEPARTTDKDHAALARARRIIARLKELAETCAISLKQAYERLLKQQAECPPTSDDEKLPSRATVYRYIARDERNLLPVKPTSVRGNRSDRYSVEVRDLVINLAAELFLIPKSRWGKKRLLEEINEEAKRRELIPRAASIGVEYVDRVISQYITTDVERARMDPKDAIAKKAIAKNRIRVHGIFQRVEQDALHLPFVVRTKHGLSSQIYLVYAIDCATSIHLGWYLVIGNPSVSDSLRCIERILFPKKKILDQLNITTAIDLFGIPMLFIWDNGPENKGERMEALASLDITPMHCKARAAHGKPFIERSNRSLKEALETLPGCTRFNGKDGARDPIAEGDDLMTLEALERWIVRWFYETWAHKKLERLRHAIFIDAYRGQTPTEVVKTILEKDQYVLPLPPNRKDWLLIRYEKTALTLNRKTGITIRPWQYKGPNLERLIKQFGEIRVDVYTDPDDFRYAYVPVGARPDLVPLINASTNDKTPAWSFAQARAMLANLEDPTQPPESRQFSADLADASRAPPGSRSGAKKKLTRAESKATTARAKQAAAVERGMCGPNSLEGETQPNPTEEEGLAWSIDPDATFNVRKNVKEQRT